MGRTAVNVAGQALVPTIVAKREGILDLERYRSTYTIDPLGRVEEQSGVDADLRRPEPVPA
jgi:Na+/H+-dicarboxylate symporter